MIHPTAIVSDTASIADDVQIGPYSIIGDNVEIGRGTRIDSHAVVNGPTTIGEDNHIYQFASIGDDPQDKKYADEPTTLKIGDRNTIREFGTISRGTTQDKGETVLGDDNWIMAYVHIAHDCVIGNKTIMANNATLAGHVHVGDWVIFGGFSGAHQFCKVGAHSFIGMYAGVNRDVPAYVTASGTPGAPRGTFGALGCPLGAQCVTLVAEPLLQTAHLHVLADLGAELRILAAVVGGGSAEHGK